jgi:hypothetical protein
MLVVVQLTENLWRCGTYADQTIDTVRMFFTGEHLRGSSQSIRGENADNERAGYRDG